jgi:hypothetical protein
MWPGESDAYFVLPSGDTQLVDVWVRGGQLQTAAAIS